MLTHDTLGVFARMDTREQASILRDHQLIDTSAGDAVLGHLNTYYPERHAALIAALARGRAD